MQNHQLENIQKKAGSVWINYRLLSNKCRMGNFSAKIARIG